MDDKTFAVLQDMQRDLGRVLAGQESLNGYIAAVSANVKRLEDKVETHSGNKDAHGGDVRKESWGNVVVWITLIVSVLGVGLHIFDRSQSWQNGGTSGAHLQAVHSP